MAKEGTAWFPTAGMESIKDLAYASAVLPRPRYLQLSGARCVVEEWRRLVHHEASAAAFGPQGRDSVSCPPNSKAELDPVDLASASVPLRSYAVHTLSKGEFAVDDMDAAHRTIWLWELRADPGQWEVTSVQAERLPAFHGCATEYMIEMSHMCLRWPVY